MRPRGEIRMALGAAAAEMGRGGATFRDLAHLSCVGLDEARMTLKDMTCAGELVVVGTSREPGVSRPLNLYAVPLRAEDSTHDLDDVVRCWADFR